MQLISAPTSSTTNTAALAGVIEYIQQHSGDASGVLALEKEMVIGYTFSYDNCFYH